jgi:hypothetical protein
VATVGILMAKLKLKSKKLNVEAFYTFHFSLFTFHFSRVWF